jgi:phage-related minor tail protein
MSYDRVMAADGEEHGERRRRDRVRSLVLGGVIGASAVAAGLRRARRRRKRPVQAGLAAFESAPCYRELLERERRDGP